MQDCTNKRSPLDRFIPHRASNKMHSQKIVEPMIAEEWQENYQNILNKEMLGQKRPEGHILGMPSKYCMSSVKNLLLKRGEHVEKKITKRNVQLQPEKILDAPEIKDDYYLNLLDWSRGGVLSIGLGERVYLYSPLAIRQLCLKEDDYICSLSFHPTGDQLAVGLSSGKIELYDVERERLVKTIKGHSNRVSSAAFTYGMLFTGSKDSKILGHDYRSSQSGSMKLLGHRGQVCGLKHDACGLASGSNDNMALVWDLNAGRVRHQLQGHKAAVKALAWCPWQRNLLATGGGTSDQTMRFWNIETGKLINTVNTESQVCSLVWNPKDKQILSSHGFSENQLSLWRYSGFNKIVDLHGHSQRVLHMVLSPDNSTVCTASADQTLRFWKVFEGSQQSDYEKGFSALTTKCCALR